jgi:hypothetical protein
MEAFMTPFFAETRSATPPDAQEVASAVARVIALPVGERPLHTVVAPMVAQRQAPQAANDAATQATQAFFKALALPLVTIAPLGREQGWETGVSHPDPSIGKCPHGASVLETDRLANLVKAWFTNVEQGSIS